MLAQKPAWEEERYLEMSGRKVLCAKGTVSAKAPREKLAWHVWVTARHPTGERSYEDERNRMRWEKGTMAESIFASEISCCVCFNTSQRLLRTASVYHRTRPSSCQLNHCAETEITQHRHGLLSKAQLHYMENIRAWKPSVSLLTL